MILHNLNIQHKLLANALSNVYALSDALTLTLSEKDSECNDREDLHL